MSHVTSRSCDGMWNMKHEEWCHKWCHMEKGYKHGKSYLNQGLRYIFRIIKAWRPCEWQKGINKIENKRIMRIKKRYSWIYLTGKWIPYISSWDFAFAFFWSYHIQRSSVDTSTLSYCFRTSQPTVPLPISWCLGGFADSVPGLYTPFSVSIPIPLWTCLQM